MIVDTFSSDFQTMIVSDRRSWFGKMIVSDRRSRKKVSCLTLIGINYYISNFDFPNLQSSGFLFIRKMKRVKRAEISK